MKESAQNRAKIARAELRGMTVPGTFFVPSLRTSIHRSLNAFAFFLRRCAVFGAGCLLFVFQRKRVEIQETFCRRITHILIDWVVVPINKQKIHTHG
jgi:hypothetical protein